MKRSFSLPEAHLVKLDSLPDGIRLDTLSDEELMVTMVQCQYQKNKTCYRSSKNFILRQIAGEPVLVPVGEDCINGMVTFNESGAYLWQLLQERRTVADLVFALKWEYAVAEDMAQADVQLFLSHALRHGMVDAC